MAYKLVWGLVRPDGGHNGNWWSIWSGSALHWKREVNPWYHCWEVSVPRVSFICWEPLGGMHRFLKEACGPWHPEWSVRSNSASGFGLGLETSPSQSPLPSPPHAAVLSPGGVKPEGHGDDHEMVNMEFTCDHCQGLIIGRRMHCNVCDDFDLCYGCYAAKKYSYGYVSRDLQPSKLVFMYLFALF